MAFLLDSKVRVVSGGNPRIVAAVQLFITVVGLPKRPAIDAPLVVKSKSSTEKRARSVCYFRSILQAMTLLVPDRGQLAAQGSLAKFVCRITVRPRKFFNLKITTNKYF